MSPMDRAARDAIGRELVETVRSNVFSYESVQFRAETSLSKHGTQPRRHRAFAWSGFPQKEDAQSAGVAMKLAQWTVFFGFTIACLIAHEALFSTRTQVFTIVVQSIPSRSDIFVQHPHGEAQSSHDGFLESDYAEDVADIDPTEDLIIDEEKEKETTQRVAPVLPVQQPELQQEVQAQDLELIRASSSAARTAAASLRSGAQRIAYFLHIHKAGGTSLVGLMKLHGERAFRGNSNLRNVTERVELASGSLEKQEALVDQLYVQNKSFVANEWMLPREILHREDLFYMTILRNPVARTESNFAMSVSQIAKLQKKNQTLATCLYGPLLPSRKAFVSLKPEVVGRHRIYYAKNSPDNWQTRALCGAVCAKVPWGALTADHLEIAKRNLASTFSIVGILEHFNETMAMFSHDLNWTAHEVDPVHLGTHHEGSTFIKDAMLRAAAEPLTLEFLVWFQATNQLDIALYNFARQVFRGQAAALGISVELGPDLGLDLELPSGKTISSGTLEALLQRRIKNNGGCDTPCCGKYCAPIGKFWRATASRLEMTPPLPVCELDPVTNEVVDVSSPRGPNGPAWHGQEEGEDENGRSARADVCAPRPEDTSGLAYEGNFGFSRRPLAFAPVALGCLTRENSVRQACIRAVQSKAFELGVLALILASAILLGCWQPVDSVLGIPSSINVFILRAEWFFQAAFTLEFFVKLVALGATPQPSGFPALQSLVESMLNAGRQLGEVLLFSTAILLIFALVGVTLFKGKLRQHCAVFDETANAYLVPAQETERYCSLRPDRYGRACPAGLVCVVTDFNPHAGLQGFDNIGISLFTVFQIITLEGWSDIMFGLFETGPRALGIYFLLLILFGAYFMVNLLVAVLSVHYKRVRKRDEERQLVMHRANTEIKTMVADLERRGAAVRSFATRPFSEQLAITQMRLIFSYEQHVDDPDYDIVSEKDYLELRARHALDYTTFWRPHFQRIESEMCLHKAKMIRHARALDRLNQPRLRFLDAHSSLASVYQTMESEQEYVRSELATLRDLQDASTDGQPSALQSKDTDKREDRLEHEDRDCQQNASDGLVQAQMNASSRHWRSRDVQRQPNSRHASYIASSSSMRKVEGGGRLAQTRLWISHNITERAWFGHLALLLIGANAVCLATFHFGQSEQLTHAQTVSNIVFLAFFTLEILLRIAGDGAQRYFESVFNLFDCIVVLIGYIELAFPSSLSLSALRVLRFLRILGPNTYVPGYHEILTSLNCTVVHVAPFLVFLALILYIFAVAGLHLFGGHMIVEEMTPVRTFIYPDAVSEPASNTIWVPNEAFDCTKLAGDFYRELANGTFVWHCPPRVNFDNFLWAFVTTFQVITSEDWNGAMFEVVERTGSYLPTIYFVLSVAIGSFVVLNFFLAILIDTFVQNHKELSEAHNSRTASPRSIATRTKANVEVRDASPAQSRRLATDGMSSPPDLESASGINPHDLSARRKQMMTSFASWNSRSASSSASSNTSGSASADSNSSGAQTSDDEPDVVAKPPHETSLQDILNRQQRKKYNLSPRELIKLPGFRYASLCGQLPYDNPLRIAVGVLVHQAWFDALIMLTIIWSCVLLALDSPVHAVATAESMLAMNIAITVIFALEAILRILAMGFVRHKGSYLRNPWNVLDFAILVISILDVCLPQDEFTEAVKVIRIARVLRPLRIIQRFEGLRIVANSFGKAIIPCGQVMVLCLYFFAIFSISASSAFQGRLNACYECPLSAESMTNSNTSSADSATATAAAAASCVRNYAPSGRDCFRYPDYGVDATVCPDDRLCAGVNEEAGVEYVWSLPTYGNIHSTNALATPYSFDNFGSSLLVLFETSSLELWMEPMYAIADITSIGSGPIRGSNDGASIFYVVFLFTMQCFVLQIFVAVIVNTYLDSSDQVTGNAFMTTTQRAWLEFHQRGMKRPFKPSKEAFRPVGHLRSRVYDVVTSYSFDIFVNAVIVANTVWMMAEHMSASSAFEKVFWAIDGAFGAVYVLEAALKLLGLGPRRYFKQKSNCFDFSIVLFVLVDWSLVWSSAPVDVAVLRAIEALRVLRVVRLLKFFRPLKVLVMTLLTTLFPVLNVSGLIGLVFFIYSVLGMSLFGGNLSVDDATGEYFSELANFDTFGNAFYTLVVLSTGEDWNGYMRELQKAVPAHAGWFVISFVLLTQMILMNLFVAVILANYTTQFERAHIHQIDGIKDHLDDHSFREYNRAWNELFEERVQALRKAAANETIDGQVHCENLQHALRSPMHLPAEAFTKLVVRLEAPLGLSKLSAHEDLGFTPGHVLRMMQGRHVPIDSNGQIEFYATLSALIDINMLVEDVPETVRAFLQHRVGASHLAYSGSIRQLFPPADNGASAGLPHDEAGEAGEAGEEVGQDPTLTHVVARAHISLRIRRYVLRWRLRKARELGVTPSHCRELAAQIVSAMRPDALTVA
ncbi:Sodium channel protein type 10 subunit alpha [Hondaea fermentalgiana]|uniref:Sodium channel protein type 10 subunit alpha n=1 Tax=Hondaea fermentalgiana TaxID=2315210 RepID=A0A2R5GHX5_9STRA|nr:Sodium channel protein type 10 subunit alpha [Hondaea fermentalgiana]|eukprot:GBG27891.1 Sodium channel protein type 10 subunit alpha [Hondaea fermentalgiana]